MGARLHPRRRRRGRARRDARRFPLAVGEIRASGGGDAPTVLVYGHFDVQPPAPLEEWESPPFEPDDSRRLALRARNGRRQGPALHAAEGRRSSLAEAGELPVNVRFVCDGEEETGGHQVVDFIERDERGADAAVDLRQRDAPARRAGVPHRDAGARLLPRPGADGGAGSPLRRLRRRGAERHRRAAAGAAAACCPARAGCLPEPLRAGVVPPTERGARSLAGAGSGPRRCSPKAAPGRPTRRRRRSSTSAPGPSRRSTINGFVGGEPHLQKTVLPVLRRGERLDPAGSRPGP